MDIQLNITKGFRDFMIDKGWSKFTLHGSGGSDESYFELDNDSDSIVECLSDAGEGDEILDEVVRSICPDFSGAGDGSEYGFHASFDLEKNEVTYSDYYHAKTASEETIKKLALEEE